MREGDISVKMIKVKDLRNDKEQEFEDTEKVIDFLVNECVDSEVVPGETLHWFIIYAPLDEVLQIIDDVRRKADGDDWYDDWASGYYEE